MSDFLLLLPGYHLRRAASVTFTELSELLRDLDLRPADAAMLVIIAEQPRITPSELGKALGIQRANMVPMVARMEDRGAIFRSPLDGRSFGIELTPEGSALCARARQVMTAFEERLTARIPPEHRTHLLPALRSLWDDDIAD
jgi:DNA-binding MarR family transcriptional regulator